jgi:Bacterial regulatory protein, Fis family
MGRRRAAVSLGGWVGSPFETSNGEMLANTHGNRTASAHLLGVSVLTLRNRICEYLAERIDVPRHESQAGWC